ncbi:MAG: hypothetical protein UW23_C0043G0008 [Candidatus Collierbacteria bacterium GW2011_GWA1_44_12]|uniref:Uncharacterized protein n=1 Tax=Candidatus Collierbacteria bacterium GW2011_GWA1_44_12 TaxID=1618376 RepID=A0A0G1JG31_9BACT|nr:MAG: hypothetical protein UW23_C0043G0008 [Candidatus Collierbacteria bacterium GW2011_GWA1_44_12]
MAGSSPTFPVIAEVPVLVMFGVPAKIAKLSACPRLGEVAAYTGVGAVYRKVVKRGMKTSNDDVIVEKIFLIFI